MRVWNGGLVVKTLRHYGFDLSPSSSIIVFSSYLEGELGTRYVLKCFSRFGMDLGCLNNRNDRFTLVKPIVV